MNRVLKLNKGDYVFCSVPIEYSIDNQKIVCSFIENEGKSLILSKGAAELHNLEFSGIWAWITIQMYTSLLDVGLTVLISSALAKHEIPCNIVAAFHHDHVFVPIDKSREASIILQKVLDNES